jgi:hypothetical protein
LIVGIDFGAPRQAREQRRKIVAIGARPLGRRRYRVEPSGLNARLLASDPPGWSARELADELLARPARVVGFDFPFSLPSSLLLDPRFASQVGYDRGPFARWRAFSAWVARRLPLTDPLDFTPFAPWRDPADRARLWSKRATDLAAGAQPPLKDRFQATFQMTLLGNALLSALWESRQYRVLPFPGGGGAGEVIEVYPRATLRALGLASYKARPEEAVRACVAACRAADIRLEVDPEFVTLACRYSTGTTRSPDHDVADAFVALCTAILHAEGASRPLLAPDSGRPEGHLRASEGAIWVPVTVSAAARSPRKNTIGAGGVRAASVRVTPTASEHARAGPEP